MGEKEDRTENLGATHCSSSVYTPAWKDGHGNRIIFLSKSCVFDCSGLAHAQQILAYAAYREFGFRMDGVAKLDVKNDGGYSIPHVDVNYGHYDGHCIGGPIFEAAS